MSKKAYQAKTFRRENWKTASELKNFRTLGQKFRQDYRNRIQQHQRNHFRKRKFFRLKLLFFIFVSGLGGWNFVFLIQKPGRLSKRVPENNPIKMLRWQENKKETISVIFFQLFCRKFCSGSQNCKPNVHLIIFRFYFFCKNLPFFKCFLTWSGNFVHSWALFSVVSSNLVLRVQRNSMRRSVFLKSFRVHFKSLGNSSKNNLFFVEKSMHVVQ